MSNLAIVEEPGYRMVPWGPMVCTVLQAYAREVTLPNGSDPRRIGIIARHVIDHVDPTRNPESLGRGDFRDYVTARRAEGVQPATIRRELSIFLATLRHGAREDRFKFDLTGIAMPPGGEPRKRFLTEEEKRRLMLTPKPTRIHLFYLVAFATAARAKAIEELTWDRVDFVQGLIDFHVPGARRTKKRRAVVPISNELRPRLESAYTRRTDEYVIGAGCSTFVGCKKAMKAAGIDEKGVCRHVARKTFASHAVQAGVPYAHIGGVLGDTAATTEKSYGFLRPEHLIAAVNFRLPQ